MSDVSQDPPRRAAASPESAPGPKAYTPPTLTEYGSLTRLTASGGSTLLEGSAGRMMMGMGG